MKIPLIIKAFYSPFKRPKLHFYFGKIAIGVPIFYPRVWKKATPKKAIEEANKEIKRVKEHNSVEANYKITVHSFGDLYERYLRSSFSSPKKIGFDFRDIMWKTKWSSKDFRFEFGAVWSFVCFGYQIAIQFIAPEQHNYWECFLYYHFETDKTKSWSERVEQGKREFPQVWTQYSKGGEEKIDYWELVVKDKYKKQCTK